MRVADVRWGELVGNLAMLQDENEASWFSPYQTNSSLWSLSYEWACFMLLCPPIAGQDTARDSSGEWWRRRWGRSFSIRSSQVSSPCS